MTIPYIDEEHKEVSNDTPDVTPDVASDVLEEKLSKLTERQRRIYERMVATGKHDVLENVLENDLETSVTLARHFEVSERTIRRDLAELQHQGLVRHDGPDKGGRWIIEI